MLNELRLLWRIRPYYNRLKEVRNMKFTSKLQMWLHVLTILAGLGVSLAPILPDDQKVYVLAVTGAIQAFLAKLGTVRNPDGTPAAEAYVAPPK